MGIDGNGTRPSFFLNFNVYSFDLSVLSQFQFLKTVRVTQFLSILQRRRGIHKFRL